MILRAVKPPLKKALTHIGIKKLPVRQRKTMRKFPQLIPIKKVFNTIG